MGMQDEVLETVVSVSMKTLLGIGNLIESVLKALAALPEQSQGKVPRTQSPQVQQTVNYKQINFELKIEKQKVYEMEKTGRDSHLVDITNNPELDPLKKACNKYQMEYSVVVNKVEMPEYTFFFKAENVKVINKFAEQALDDMKIEKNKDRAENKTKEENKERGQNKEKEQDKDIVSPDIKKGTTEMGEKRQTQVSTWESKQRVSMANKGEGYFIDLKSMEKASMVKKSKINGNEITEKKTTVNIKKQSIEGR